MPDVWDGAAADAMLAAHEFRQLDALLRCWIDGARSHEAVDWVDARAEEGHVPVLYHAVRNLAKGGRGGALGGAEFRRVFRLALMLLVRAAQDVLAISVVQGQPPRASTFAILRDKAFGWLTAQFPVARWPPLGEVLEDVARALPAAPPLPAWVLASGPGLMTAYLHLGAHIAFDNPSDKAVAACEKTRIPLDEERSRVAGTFFAMVGGMSWEGVTAMAVSAFLGNHNSGHAQGIAATAATAAAAGASLAGSRSPSPASAGNSAAGSGRSPGNTPPLSAARLPPAPPPSAASSASAAPSPPLAPLPGPAPGAGSALPPPAAFFSPTLAALPPLREVAAALTSPSAVTASPLTSPGGPGGSTSPSAAIPIPGAGGGKRHKHRQQQHG
jgi:hypothetical protein